MVKTTNTRNKAEKQQLLENEEMENNRRKMDHEAQLNKHIFEKKKPRPGAEESKAKPKAPGGADDLWDPILHVDDEDSQLPQWWINFYTFSIDILRNMHFGVTMLAQSRLHM